MNAQAAAPIAAGEFGFGQHHHIALAAWAGDDKRGAVVGHLVQVLGEIAAQGGEADIGHHGVSGCTCLRT